VTSTDRSTQAPEVPAALSEPLKTIAQIAERAGVSIATVSKVVNGRTEVASETRAHVESVIRRHGYRRQQKAAAGPGTLVELGEEAAAATVVVALARGEPFPQHRVELPTELIVRDSTAPPLPPARGKGGAGHR
jgi:LacI family transcriptional regulator, xylobiose transport system transcriptional regulator